MLALMCVAQGLILTEALNRQPMRCDGTKDACVEIDFSTLPREGDGQYQLTLTILTADKDIKFSEPSKLSRKTKPETICEVYADWLRENRFKVEVVDKTKLRVFGRNFNDKLIPATKGIFESPDLKKEELPKVKNAGKDA